MVQDATLPIQPFNVGVILIVAICGIAVLFAEVKLGAFPIPEPASPIVVFELVHAQVDPAGTVIQFDAETSTEGQ